MALAVRMAICMHCDCRTHKRRCWWARVEGGWVTTTVKSVRREATTPSKVSPKAAPPKAAPSVPISTKPQLDQSKDIVTGNEMDFL